MCADETGNKAARYLHVRAGRCQDRVERVEVVRRGIVQRPYSYMHTMKRTVTQDGGPIL